MPIHIKQLENSIGFGVTPEDAEVDAYINMCKVSLSNDFKSKYSKKREETHPWLPKPTMLHISGVGCLWYHDTKITETKSSKSLVVSHTGPSIFTYLSELFGSALSYTDIVCTYREEIDAFFMNISKDFIPVKNMPIVQILRESDSFIPEVVYSTRFGFSIGITDNEVGIRFLGEDCYYLIPVASTEFQMDAVYYLLSRAGYALQEGRLIDTDG